MPFTLKIGALPPCLFYGTVEPLNTKSVGHIVSLCYQDFVLSGAKTYKISARDMNITLLSGFLCFLTEFVFKGSQCRPPSWLHVHPSQPIPYPPTHTLNPPVTFNHGLSHNSFHTELPGSSCYKVNWHLYNLPSFALERNFGAQAGMDHVAL